MDGTEPAELARSLPAVKLSGVLADNYRGKSRDDEGVVREAGTSIIAEVDSTYGLGLAPGIGARRERWVSVRVRL